MRRRHLAFPIAAALSVLPSTLFGQTDTVSVIGTVMDGTTGQPVASVTVSIGESGPGTLTDTNGGFLLTGIPSGTHVLRVQRIGYAPIEQDLYVTPGQPYFVLPAPLWLQPAAIGLVDLSVVGRRARYVFNRRDIDSISPMLLSDIWRTIPQLRLTMAKLGPGGEALRRSLARSGQSVCVPMMFINGRESFPGEGRRLDEVYAPSQIDSVEVFLRWTDVPVQYRRGNHTCEVIAIWSR